MNEIQTKTLYTRAQFPIKTEEEWLELNPVLRKGEIVFVSNSNGMVQQKVGNGIDNFNNLPYMVNTYNYIITTLDELLSLETLGISGKVLVELSDSFPTDIGDKIINIPATVSLLDFDKSNISLDGHGGSNYIIFKAANKSTVIKNINISLNEGWYFTFDGFGTVEDCIINGYGSCYGTLENCDHITKSTFSSASNCNYIDNCVISGNLDGRFDNCKFICGITSQVNYEGQVIFNICSYLSNIFTEGEYNNCSYVDTDTCCNFIKPEDINKVQLLTSDGSFATFNIGDIDTALDNIIAIQENIIGGNAQ